MGGASAAIRLECAYYAPDRGTPYAWFEGARDIQSFFAADYRAAGTAYAYIRNEGDEPLSPTEFLLDGTPADELREQQRLLWWRLLPRPLAPGAVGEVAVRFGEALTQPAELEARFDAAPPLRVTITPDPNPLRIETVGFTEALDEVFLVAEALDRQPHRLTAVRLDGPDVTARSHLLDPAFSLGAAPVVIRLEQPLVYGSCHVLQVVGTEGETAACCVRAYDGWVPLGSYGYTTFEEYARNGTNGHNNFGVHSRGDLDLQALLGMRGVLTIGDNTPEPYMRGHPGLFAYCLADEPDCMDYSAEEWPPARRIGFNAMEMQRRAQTCREADPQRLTFLTVDLTYKPANYYIYGPIADVTNADCYPFSIGADARMVREVVETARLGTGPRPLTFTFQGMYEEPFTAEGRAAMRFPRPPFAQEERLMHYYAIGAGARGLYNYIHCTEKSARYTSRGSGEFPDVWYEIGRTYRELEHVAPLLALAHPTTLATADREGVWLRALLCGEEAVLVVCVSDRYEQLAQSFRCPPVADLTVTLPRLPWLEPQQAWRVTQSGFEPLELRGEAGNSRVHLDRLEVAELLLLSSDPRLARRLEARYERRQERVGAGLVQVAQERLAADAAERREMRRVVGEYPGFVVYGTPVSAYGVTDAAFWNPAGEEYPAFEFGVNDETEGPAMGVQWALTVPPARAGARYTIYLQHGAWGRPGLFTVTDGQGREVFRQELPGGWPGSLTALEVGPLTAGQYQALLAVPGPGPKGGRAARALYFVPG